MVFIYAGVVHMAERLAARLNLRLSEGTYDSFKAAADEMGVDVSALVRQCLDGSAPAMQAVADSLHAMKSGRVVSGVGLYGAFLRSVLAQSDLGERQLGELEHWAREFEGSRAEDRVGGSSSGQLKEA